MNFYKYTKSGIVKSVLVISAFAITSCQKDILNTVPTTSISQVNAYSTPAKILAEVNNLYSQIQSPNFYGGRYIITNEQRGEEFGQNDANAAVGSLIWQQNPLSTDALVNSFWTQAYLAINASNIFIAQVSNSTAISSTLKAQYIGEAKFIRAISYLSLIQTFSQPYTLNNGTSLGVPLRLTAETSSADNNLARSSVKDVYTQIISDLNDAEASLPISYTTAALNSSRAHQATAIALKTRVYLVEGDYTSVVKEAKKIVPTTSAPFVYTNGTLTHQLESNIATVFGGSYTGQESIFSLPFNAVDAPGTQASLAQTYYGSAVLTLTKAGIYANNALSGTTSTDARKNLITTKSGQNDLIKFKITVSPYSDYIPVIRYAEVLLNYAEATAVSDPTTSLALLNAIRKRSDPSYSFISTDINTPSALLNTILTERRIELLGEGFREPDLQRKLQALPSKIGSIGTAPAVATTASNYIWPIPASELANNNLAVPNP